MPVSPGEDSRFTDLYELHKDTQDALQSPTEQHSGFSVEVGRTTGLRSADDENHAGIDSIRSEWSMREVAMPTPPGADEIDIESFHHESSL